jgi:hypothetical protein
MNFLEIIRLEFNPTEVIGSMLVNGKLFCCTLEPPNRNNMVGESCVPTGRYLVKRYLSKKFGCDCLALHNVVGRSFISVHPGNTAADTQGCILPGVMTGYLKEQRAVLQSKTALNALLDFVPIDATLIIRNCF